MSTEINIKKSIAVNEEGIQITPNANSLNFTGAGVTASTVGNDVTVDITSASGSVLYYMNQTVAQAPYREFSSAGTTAAEQAIPATVAGGATVTIAAFQTPSGVPNTIVIPQGQWQFFLHFNAATGGQNWIIRPLVYKRDLGGTETLLFSIDPITVTNMSTVTTLYSTESVVPNTILLTTDRIVVKINMENTRGVSQTVDFRTEGSQHYSVATTTLNQAIPTGAVTSVTGTAPVVSSGGTAPAISMAQANGSTDGYLDSADWTTFNNKPDNLNQLNDVDVTTIVPTDGQVLTYDTISGLWKNESLSATPTAQVVLFADLATTEVLKPCTYNNGALGVGATLTGNTNGQLATVSFTGRIDNTVTALGQIILVRAQSSQFQNGLYEVTQLGSLTQPFIITRTTDADTQDELYPVQVNVFGGVTQANLAYLQKTVNPIIGTNPIVFTTTQLGIQNTPVLHVDTVTTAPLPACTYTSGTNPTLPGSGAFLEANVNGPFPAINGVTLTAGRRFLVKDQVNQAHNGTYSVSSLGGVTAKWRIFRVDAWGGNFTILDREWKVNNPASTKYGARYSTNLLSLSNTAIGTSNIQFTEIFSVPISRSLTVNGVAQDLSANRTWNVGTVTSVGVTAGAGISVGGTNPVTSSGSITVTNTAPDQVVVLTPGAGIGVTGTYPNFTIANSAPDQVVALSAGAGIGITGTYPNFTISGSGSPSAAFIPAIEQSEIRRGAIALVSSITIGTFGALTPVLAGTSAYVAVLFGGTVPLPKVRMLTTGGGTNGVVGMSFGSQSVVNTLGKGFRFIGSWIYSDQSSGGTNWFVPGARQFCGLSSLTTVVAISSTVTVESLTNIIGMGSDAADTNLQIFHNDASGTATKIDLGVNFPANKSGAVTNGEAYQLELYNQFGSTSVKYRVRKLSDGTEVTGTISTNLPTVAIGPQIVRTSGSTSQNISIELIQLTAYTRE